MHNPQNCTMFDANDTNEVYLTSCGNVPGNCSSSVEPLCVMARFASPTQAIQWFEIFCCCCYLVELFIRLYHYFHPNDVHGFRLHPQRVLELRIKKRNKEKAFKCSVGQYIYLKINAVSYIEYHPFTLTSAPEDDFYMVNIKQNGDWTSRLYDVFAEIKENPDKMADESTWPKIAIDGPFFASSMDLFGMFSNSIEPLRALSRV